MIHQPGMDGNAWSLQIFGYGQVREGRRKNQRKLQHPSAQTYFFQDETV